VRRGKTTRAPAAAGGVKAKTTGRNGPSQRPRPRSPNAKAERAGAMEKERASEPFHKRASEPFHKPIPENRGSRVVNLHAATRHTRKDRPVHLRTAFRQILNVGLEAFRLIVCTEIPGKTAIKVRKAFLPGISTPQTGGQDHSKQIAARLAEQRHHKSEGRTTTITKISGTLEKAVRLA